MLKWSIYQVGSLLNNFLLEYNRWLHRCLEGLDSNFTLLVFRVDELNFCQKLVILVIVWNM
jgi:hypothetical protein